jgi:large subunit ribosomal protein L24
VQTTLLGLAIAFIIALIAALIGPYFIDWNQFRPQFEAEATRVIGAPVRVAGAFEARLLPSPSLRLRSVVVGGANDLGKVRADKLDVEFSLGSLMRGEWRATELTINGMALDLGLDPQGRIDWPASTGRFNFGTLAIDRLNLTGRIALHDALSRGTLELNDIAFSGDVRSLAGSVRGDGNFVLSGTRYPFRVSSGQSAEGGGTRVHFNIDPGARAASADLDGVLSFEARAPRFEGTVTLASSAGPKAKAGTETLPTPWRVSVKVRADHAAAKLEQIETSFGTEDTALKFTGLGDVRFGSSPMLRATMSARQLDADKFAARDSSKDTGAAEPLRVMSTMRAIISAAPELPIPTQIELAAEQIMLGGRPLQNFAAELRTDTKSWTIDRLDFRAPGTTRLSLSGTNAQAGLSGGFKGALNIESSDPDALVMWLLGRGELTYRSQKPLRLRGDISVTAESVAIDAIKAEIDGGDVAGRITVSHDKAGGATSLDAALKAERLDLDAASAFARTLLGPQAEWPEQAMISLDVAHAISAGQDLHPFTAKFGYGPNSFLLERLKIGQPNGVTLEGGGNFDRANLLGKLTLGSTAASLGQLTGLVAPFAPSLASRLNVLGSDTGPVRGRLTLELTRDKAVSGPVVLGDFDIDAAQFKGRVGVTVQPSFEALHAIDLDKLRLSEIKLESKISLEKGPSLLALLGLDGTIGAGQGPAQFQGSVTGAWGAPLRLNLKISGVGLDAEAQGTAEPWSTQPKGSIVLKARSLNLAPLFDLRVSDKLAQNISLSSRVSLLAGKLTFEDLDGAMAGSRLRGRVALTLDGERNVEGEVGLDALDLAPAFALAIGSAGRDASEPLGSGLLKGWRGRIAFQALRGLLPGGTELRPVSGAVKGDGQSLVFDALKGGIGGGEASGSIDARQTANGLALNARLQFTAVDGAALHYRALAMPAGRASMQMTLASQGRSASALTGALSGSGTVTLESARVAGLDPRAFDVAIRASDAGQATDDIRLRKIVEPVLAGGALSVASVQIPFTIGDGRLRVGATTLDAEGARAIVSGGYDIPADQADIRATLTSAGTTQSTGRPEIQVFATGSPDLLDRTVDIAALSSWLAVRAIDRETRRLDSIERGERPPAVTPASIPPDVQAKPKVSAPRSPVLPPATNAPPITNAPVVSQQAPPLPPPIDIRPAPSVPRPAKPKPPLVLTPPAPSPTPF